MLLRKEELVKVPPSFTVSLCALVLVLAFLFGPVVPSVALSSQSGDHVVPASGTVNVTVEEMPDELTISKRSFGAGTYGIESNAVRTTVSEVAGNPLVVYRLRIPALEFDKQTYRILSTDVSGALEIRHQPITFQPYQITQKSYQATVTVLVRDEDGKRIVEKRQITIRVTE